jgi:hypothetical protein
MDQCVFSVGAFEVVQAMVRSKATGWKRAMDWGIYCAIGISVALIAIASGIYRAKTNQPSDLATKWVGFSFMTLLVFVGVFRSCKYYWGAPRFWKAIIPISLIHLSMGVVVIGRLGMVALISFVPAGLIEYFVVTTLLHEFLIRERRD